jgi:hypothetical protein
MSVLWFDGLLTRLEDAGVYFLPEDDLDELLEAAAVNNFPLLRVNLAGCATKPDLLLRLAGVLRFPPYVANNFDALADALGELCQPDAPGLVLLLEHSDDLRREAPADLKTTMEVLQAASREWAGRGRPLWTFLALVNDEFDALP